MLAQRVGADAILYGAMRHRGYGAAAETQRPVQFEVTEQTRSALAAWIHQVRLRSENGLFPGRLHRLRPPLHSKKGTGQIRCLTRLHLGSSATNLPL
jgi:hypothetical protein